MSEAMGLKGRRSLDVGCACGSLTQAFNDAGVPMSGIDLSEHMIGLGKAKWPHLELWVGDARTLPVVGNTIDFIHCAQVAEHFDPRHVTTIFREWRRVLTDYGRVFLCMDTTELYERQHRDPATEDPTHTCLKPFGWWEQMAMANGFRVGDRWNAMSLVRHPESFLREYDWDWMILVKE